jgi:phage terminase Nu1 subunit (DNA packaging protein)
MAAATYPVTTIAKLLLLTERRVQQLTAQGVLPKAERGRYELAPVVQAYVRYLRDRSVGADAAGPDEIGANTARLVRARARAAEIELEELEGKRFRSEDVTAAWQALVGAVRARVLAMPTKLVAVLSAEMSQRERSAVITAVVHEALEELSRTPVYVSPDRGAAKPGAADGEDVDALEAAAGVDGEPVGGSGKDPQS